ncbi:MAG: hypothetical protein H6837_21080, partial [Planctomycetes bacterium]|nr:hypothetical protein [Planctomycetota bacterium]
MHKPVSYDQLGAALILVPGLTLALASAAIWVSMPVGIWAWCGAATVPCAWLARRAGRRTCLAAIGVLSGSVFLAWSCYDVSFDGRYYHLETVLHLARGWVASTEPPQGASAMTAHFARGMETIGASLVVSFQELEVAKASNFILAAGVFFMAFGLARQRFGCGRRSTVLAFLTAAHPITLAQLCTTYVDGALNSADTALVLALASDPRRVPWLVRGAATLLLCQAKFTGVVYSAVLWITWATIEMVALKRIGWRETGGATLTLCVVAILSWYPYATNWCEHGHAFHPALG